MWAGREIKFHYNARKDKMPARSFLPRAIASKLPFSSSVLTEIKGIFYAREGSVMERVIVNALKECERAPSKGETKRCVGSAEAMIRFTSSVLSHNIVVRTTKNVNRSSKSVMIKTIKGINDGQVTEPVSCHQIDIVDMDTKAKINHGVAVCHIDTSAWGPEHGAFLALGSSPGKIEVCHWIFENDNQENGHVPAEPITIDLDYYSIAEELMEVGPEKLKEALAALGLKTGGIIQQRAEMAVYEEAESECK